MKIADITSDTLPRAVAFAMVECQSQIVQSPKPVSSALLRDLNAALSSLHLIDFELKHGQARPEGQRSAAFTRYVIDEEPNMTMSAELKQLIVKIEDVYRRYHVQ